MRKWRDEYKGSADAQRRVVVDSSKMLDVKVEVEVGTDAEGVEGEDGGQKMGYTNNVSQGAGEKMCRVRQMPTKVTLFIHPPLKKKRQITHRSRSAQE